MTGFLRSLAQSVYDSSLRHHIPRTLGVYNGVVTRKYYLLDLSKADHEPGYKETLVSAAREVTEPGDRVVEIGSGFGVCTVWLARRVGPEGEVVSFEAGDEQVSVTREALELNGEILDAELSARTTVRHALVASGKAVYGPSNEVKTVPVGDLPDCDVVVTDCEGAEVEILEDLKARPRVIVVETHPNFGAPTETVEATLDEYGYASERKHVFDTDGGPKHIVIAWNDEFR